MPNPGRIVICAMLAVGLAAAGFSVWYHYQGAHRSGDFWGTATAQLIVEAPQVRILQLEALDQPRFDTDGMELEPPEDADVEFGNGFWKVLREHDASKARGLGNIRRALVQDVSFEWGGPRPDDPNWLYAMEFSDGRLWATVLFDLDSRQVALAGARRTARLDPAAGEAWRAFLDEQFAAEEPSETPEGSDRPAEEKPADEKPPDDKPTEPPAEAP